MAEKETVDKQLATLSADLRNFGKNLEDFKKEFKDSFNKLNTRLEEITKLNGRVLVLEKTVKDNKSDIEDLQSRWGWLIKTVAGVIILALLGLVIIKPF